MRETLQSGLATLKPGAGGIYMLDFAGNTKKGHVISTARGALD